jgi:hypothetical protein
MLPEAKSSRSVLVFQLAHHFRRYRCPACRNCDAIPAANRGFNPRRVSSVAWEGSVQKPIDGCAHGAIFRLGQRLGHRVQLGFKIHRQSHDCDIDGPLLRCQRPHQSAPQAGRLLTLPPHETGWRRPRRRSKTFLRATRTSPPRNLSHRGQYQVAPRSPASLRSRILGCWPRRDSSVGCGRRVCPSRRRNKCRCHRS